MGATENSLRKNSNEGKNIHISDMKQILLRVSHTAYYNAGKRRIYFEKGRSHPSPHLSFSIRPGKKEIHLMCQLQKILVRLLAALSRGGFSDYIWDVGSSRNVCWGFGRGVAVYMLHAWHPWSNPNPNHVWCVEPKLSLSPPTRCTGGLGWALSIRMHAIFTFPLHRAEFLPRVNASV